MAAEGTSVEVMAGMPASESFLAATGMFHRFANTSGLLVPERAWT
jgi:hypothetical protein